MVEAAIIISGISVAFGIYQGIINLKRNEKQDVKTEIAQLTSVIIKLENIGDGVSEIKHEISNIKFDIKESRERLVKVEESAKSAHKRLDVVEKYHRGVARSEREE